ncbi:aminotransferase class IV [Poritiphilus flavus]|uniref:branched-chain-amino-acid transaminase n=1 Tax=Poritiphilus flavus TaxID=2697053 RepID=A0A6L9EE19_9FLAO|nr:aminotransferase class IV [Poritiphilus flavus]NAS12947.1 aminotransferase class IV [Poritiphilus flavus]
MVNYNGNLVGNDSSFLNHENRGLRYGDALFETLRVKQSGILFWEDHYFRLMASMRMLRMEIPMDFTLEYLNEQIKQTLQANSLSNSAARVRLTVFRNNGGRYLPQTNEVSFIIETEALDSEEYTLNQRPYEIELYKDYFLAPGLLSGLKTANKAINVLGSIYAKENGYQNCLLLNVNKEVVEALHGNLFLVQGQKIKTPPLSSGCLNGVMRKQLIELLKADDTYQLEEGTISPFDLQKADELFITNVIAGVQPVSKYRKAQYKSIMATELIHRLNKNLEKLSSD